MFTVVWNRNRPGMIPSWKSPHRTVPVIGIYWVGFIEDRHSDPDLWVNFVIISLIMDTTLQQSEETHVCTIFEAGHKTVTNHPHLANSAL